MENVRERAKHQVQDAKNFGIQKFAKDMLEIADVLQVRLWQIQGNKWLNFINYSCFLLFYNHYYGFFDLSQYCFIFQSRLVYLPNFNRLQYKSINNRSL